MNRPSEKDLPPAPWLSVRARSVSDASPSNDASTSAASHASEAMQESLGARLFERGQVLVEGGLDVSSLADNDYAYATVMLTIDVRDLPLAPGDRADAITAQRWATQLVRDCEVRACLMKIAGQKIEEILGRHLGDARIELDLRARAESTRILLDADAMVSLPSAAASPQLCVGSRSRYGSRRS